jgi:hypothetical protein
MLVCTFPSCNDSIKNQNETGVDCGGPCPKQCGNCSDGLKNQGEDGVDCGGKCKPCPSCFDKVKNGFEQMIDCGGGCRACTVDDYMGKFGFIIVILVIILAGFIGLAAYVFALINPEKARQVYDNNTLFALLISMNKASRKSRLISGKKQVLSDEITKQFLTQLTMLTKQQDLKSDSSNKPFYELIIKVYTVMINLPEGFDDQIFLAKLKESKIPLMMKVLLSGYYKKAEILGMAVFVPAEQKIDLISEMKFLLLELAKG